MSHLYKYKWLVPLASMDFVVEIASKFIEKVCENFGGGWAVAPQGGKNLSRKYAKIIFQENFWRGSYRGWTIALV